MSAKKLFALGLATDMHLFTSLAEVQLRGLPNSARVRDYLDVTYGALKLAHPGLTHKELVHNFFGNPSQCLSRRPKQLASGMGTATTSTVNYSLEKYVAISVAGVMRLHGLHRHCAPAECFSEGACSSLAGDSVSVPCAALLQCAVIWNPLAPWWQR